MQLSVITVTWNAGEKIREQMQSVRDGCEKISFEQILVDNGSKDNTAEIVKSFPHAKLIANTENTGFAAANNQGVKIASGDFLLFLNPDMLVSPCSLDKLVEWLKQHPDAGMVSCKLIDTDGNFKPEAGPRRFPTVWDQSALLLKLPHIFPRILDKYLMKDFEPDKEQEVDSVRGAFMLVRKEIVEQLGWAFDPRYFIWFEDVDLCREVKRLGYKVIYTPIVSCVDYVGQSFIKQEILWKQKNFTASMLTYFQKWEPWLKWGIIWLLRPMGIAFTLIMGFCKRRQIVF
ncbi:MAG: glycosyltransferase family 2 protein [Candidatus Magasanikbacteria bacterium]|nr:glycosyltransferase family 2 protein [Candidatus Magasanikbacteria bacterium]